MLNIFTTSYNTQKMHLYSLYIICTLYKYAHSHMQMAKYVYLPKALSAKGNNIFLQPQKEKNIYIKQCSKNTACLFQFFSYKRYHKKKKCVVRGLFFSFIQNQVQELKKKIFKCTNLKHLQAFIKCNKKLFDLEIFLRKRNHINVAHHSIK